MGALDLVGNAVAVLALGALLATAWRHPSWRTEVAVSVLAAGSVVAVGLVDLGAAGTTVADLLPVVAFLVAILVVGEVCAAVGLFVAVADRVRRGRPRPYVLLTRVVLVAAAVTTVLSLDTTVVLLTPVVLAAATSAGMSARPGVHACLRMANSASLLLPVSNLTNLLALPHLDLSFAGFAARMAPVLAVVLLVEWALLRLLFRRELRGTTGPAPAPRPLPRVPGLVVALMLAGFAVLSPLGVEPAWVAGVAAMVLVGWGRRRRVLEVRDVVAGAHPSFALFVLALGVVVAGLATGFVGDLVTDLLPTSTSYVGLLGIAGVATLLANLVTNLSATLLVVPLAAPLGEAGVLAALLGLNIGAGLTYTGSLANLLWRRGLARQVEHVSLAELHRVALVVTPVSLVAAVTVLHLTT
ncbi:SLC13 family permease [Nocardioides sp. SYSU D00038]|uniref:SLC13 family permease n=1 Tax=Nocardioides sp. SYSU D00038 TaxID=2812554 RepID=UPI0019682A73|nr:SLC13 family permease [Nocardioides sp. SYSU D00038]